MNQGVVVIVKVGGWLDGVISFLDVVFNEYYCQVKVMSKGDIEQFKKNWVVVVKRVMVVGVDFVEIYNVYGYLLSFFFSLYVNRRIDGYGGSFENCIRFSLEIVKFIREVVGENIFVFFCVFVIDWVEEILFEESWIVEDMVKFVQVFVVQGCVDLIDIFLGGVYLVQKIVLGFVFQVLFVVVVKKVVGDKMFVVIVGFIINGRQVNKFLEEDGFDVVFVGCGF